MRTHIQDRASYMVVDTEFFPPPEAGGEWGGVLFLFHLFIFLAFPLSLESLSDYPF